MVTSTGTQSSYDSTTSTPYFYYHYNTSNSNIIWPRTPLFQKDDYVKLKDMDCLLREFNITIGQEKHLRKNQNVIFKVVEYFSNSIRLNKDVFGNGESLINPRALKKVDKKEILMSRMKLNEEIFKL